MTAGSPAALAESYWPDGIRNWFEERRAASSCQIVRVPFRELAGWNFDRETGNLVHQSGKFFSIEGLDVRINGGPVSHWQQPIIRQPEIGILGILVRRIDGRLHALMQAKMEPGNINGVQISPTVQATRSNYTRVHQGAAIRYLDYFIRPRPGSVLVDVLQSEQGSWFLGKRNRNMVVEVSDEPPPHDDFRWIALDDLKTLFGVDNLINMDARTVLSCLTVVFPVLADNTGSGSDTVEAAASLLRSFDPRRPARHPDVELLSWFTESKSEYELSARRIPLASVERWHRDENEIFHESARHFTVIGIDVRSSSREVSGWSQPMLVPRGRGVVAFVAKDIDGALHVLVRAMVQPGLVDTVEMGPTVQCRPENYDQHPDEQRPMFLDLVLSAPPERIRYDSILSEEGGRFYFAENRYLVVQAPEDFPEQAPEGFQWVTARQLAVLLRHSNYLNVEARTLLACLYSLTGPTALSTLSGTDS